MGSTKHISFPKIKKAVHKIMLKYGKNRFYRKIDWIEKVLKKLKIRSSPKIKARIRNHINKWLETNSHIVDSKEDNKKGVLDTIKEKEKQKQTDGQVGTSKPTTESNIPPMPTAIPIKKLQDRVPLIDITLDKDKTDKESESEVVVITIDDEIEIIEERASHEPLLPTLMSLSEQSSFRPYYL